MACVADVARESLVVSEDFATDFARALLRVSGRHLVTFESFDAVGELFAAGVARGQRLSLNRSPLGSRLWLLRPHGLLLLLLERSSLLSGLRGALELPFPGEYLVDGDEAELKLFRADLSVLRVLLLNVAHQGGLGRELPLARDALEDGRHLASHRLLLASTNGLGHSRRSSLASVELGVLGRGQ